MASEPRRSKAVNTPQGSRHLKLAAPLVKPALHPRAYVAVVLLSGALWIDAAAIFVPLKGTLVSVAAALNAVLLLAAVLSFARLNLRPDR